MAQPPNQNPNSHGNTDNPLDAFPAPPTTTPNANATTNATTNTTTTAAAPTTPIPATTVTTPSASATPIAASFITAPTTPTGSTPPLLTATSSSGSAIPVHDYAPPTSSAASYTTIQPSINSRAPSTTTTTAIQRDNASTIGLPPTPSAVPTTPAALPILEPTTPYATPTGVPPAPRKGILRTPSQVASGSPYLGSPGVGTSRSKSFGYHSTNSHAISEEEDGAPQDATEAYHDSISGRWGEGPSKVDVLDAEREFRQLERSITNKSRRSSTRPGEQPTIPEQDEDIEAQVGEDGIPLDEKFDLAAHLRDTVLPASQEAGLKKRNMGVSWRDLSVIGEGVGSQHVSTTGDPFFLIGKLLNPKYWSTICGGKNSKKVTKTILYPMDGFCEDGDMILVLGRPGAGCSTLLRVLANDRKNYKEVKGTVMYNNLTAEDVAKHYKGEVLYNQEDDFHYPTLTVRQTLETAIKAKTPRMRLPGQETREEFRENFLGLLTKMYGLTKQVDTLVGNAFIRGISGGERKRLSIAEQMATRSSVNMWDGSTRGLDASSALDYIKSLRVQTNLLRRATVVTIYQASENIYDLFDKVLLLYEGRCIYFGPADYARDYFIQMGWYCPPRQTTADFLTAVTDPHERRPADGVPANHLPTTPKEFEDRFLQSIVYSETVNELHGYQARLETEDQNEFMEASKQMKQKHVSVKNPYTITFLSQVKAMTRRQVQLTRGDIGALISRYASNIVKAVIVGTCFLFLPLDASGAFTRGGVLFFSLLFNALISQAELPISLQGRPIMYKLKNFAMYRPASFAFAQITQDIPVSLVHNLLFAIILYFLAGLQRTAAKFFIFVLIITLAALCMTTFFRMWGSVSRTFDDATKYSGLLLLAMILYSGYLVPYQAMHPWFIWIFWINPLAYAFKALMSNEMNGLRFTCSGSFLIPNGPTYNNLANQVCTLAGSKPGLNYVEGPDYLYAAFRYKVSEMWIDIVAVICFWVLFSFLTMVAMEKCEFGKGGFSTNVFKKTKHENQSVPTGSRVAPVGGTTVSSAVVPAGTGAAAVAVGTVAATKTELKDIPKGSTFAWQDVDYVVPYKSDPSGKKQLLNKIAGVVRPGTMTALMGSSGAGKTTLLDVLAQRKNTGVVTGQIEVDGQSLKRDFQRTTGYCEQLDVHVPECTVRESLRFSAYLRQPASNSIEEKNAYVEEIIHILEMENIADAIIGTTESGLGISVEERKRLTIGVELVAKPKLLFLDEPTSGLDAQASYNIMRFMRKLTDQGQAILCTIHQPSSQLFAFFDNLLLLAKGGRTVFFGELGVDSHDLIHYFEKNGAPTCAENANPAEYILDVVNARSGLDWPEIWVNSPEHARLLEDIQTTRVVDTTNSAVDVAGTDSDLEFATDVKTQIKYVFLRMARTYWRLPRYNLGRLTTLIVFALLNGFTFFRLGHGLVDLQSRVFVVFQILVMAPLFCNTVEPRFHMERQWFYREQAGKYYGRLPFGIAIVVMELPYIICSTTIFFLLFYWTVGFSTNSLDTFYTWLMLMIFTIFAITLGQWIAAWTPSVQIAALMNPFIISAMNLFCGVVVPYASMPLFWRSWMYWIVPYHYVVEGLVTTQLYNVPVVCSSTEFNIFQPPAGQTCGVYAAKFLETAVGYLNNPGATSDCQYCQYKLGQNFYANLNMDISHRWRNLGIACIYLVSNVSLIALGIRYFNANKR